jgi:hypothetical protein
MGFDLENCTPAGGDKDPAALITPFAATWFPPFA